MKQLPMYALLLLLPVFSFAQGTFTVTYLVECNDTISTGPLGFPSWNPPTIVQSAQIGSAFIDANNHLQYTATPYFQGNDTVIVACAQATQVSCDTGIYIFQSICSDSLSGIRSVQVACNGKVCVENLSAWGIPSILEMPLHGEAYIFTTPVDGAGICYTPQSDFEGTDYVLVRQFGSQQYLYVFNVSCSVATQQAIATSITAYPNPTKGDFFIEMQDMPTQVAIMGMDGKRYDSNYLYQDNRLQIRCEQLPAGCYGVAIQTESGQFISRIVVQK
jgi:Secretion system C-terminal sorting domain